MVNKSELDKSCLINVKRWYQHILTYSESEKSKFDGEKEVPLSIAGSQSESTKAKDDDFDLFGSDVELLKVI